MCLTSSISHGSKAATNKSPTETGSGDQFPIDKGNGLPKGPLQLFLGAHYFTAGLLQLFFRGSLFCCGGPAAAF